MPIVVPAKIAIPVVVPPMVVLAAAVVAVPVAAKKPFAIVAWRYPTCARIDRARPISVMPRVTAFHWIPIPVHPDVIRTRLSRRDPDHSRSGPVGIAGWESLRRRNQIKSTDGPVLPLVIGSDRDYNCLMSSTFAVTVQPATRVRGRVRPPG